MSVKEISKLLGAGAIAIAAALLCGFVARGAVHPGSLSENAYKIAVSADTAPAPSAPSAAAAPAPAPAAEAKAEPVLGLIASADPAAGEKVTKICATCHTFKKGEPSRVGPNLYGIVGSKHAQAAGFAYSPAMKAMAGETWTMAELNVYLWNPKKHVPGNKMAYAGMKKPEDRAAAIAFLRSHADAPVPLPSAEEIEAEKNGAASHSHAMGGHASEPPSPAPSAPAPESPKAP